MSYRINNLRFAYASSSVPVLKGVSAHIAKGEFTAIVGPNGAGKSTFLKVIAGLLPRYTGVIELEGRPLASYSARSLAQRVAFVPQETHVTFPFRAREIVMMGRLPHRAGGLFDSPADVRRVEAAMEVTDSGSLAHKPFQELSGGERQRVVLACALAQDPEILLLDEPTVYLDLKHQIQFYDILERLNLERRITVISVTHDINLAARYARRMIAVRDGTVAADGRPEEVLTPERLYEIFEINAAVLQRPDGRGSFIVASG